MLNRDALGKFAETLKQRPRGMSSIEEATELVTETGVSCRVTCDVLDYQRQVRLHLVASTDSEPVLKVKFPARDEDVELHRSGRNEWEGVFEYHWDDFFLQLSYESRVARVRIYGPCAAAVAHHWQSDVTIPVLGLWEIGEAMVEVLTGQPIPAGPYVSELWGLLHTAERAAEVLSRIASES
jgi:hypothetical protein